ncbi:MAG TPA: hypothetical protein VNS63_15255 [Blastocatellia bacterium]|nr:hypothetical protein [Blastocatellia bacterium]
MKSARKHILLTIFLMTTGSLVWAVLLPRHGLGSQARKSTPPTWGKPSGGFQLLVELEKESFSSQEPIEIHISLKNVSSKTIMIEQTAPWRDYSIEIRNEEGKEVAFSDARRRLEPKSKDDLITSHKPTYLPAGGIVEDHLTLNKMFDLTARGTYSVTVRRSVHKYDQKWLGVAEVTSNTAKIKLGA